MAVAQAAARDRAGPAHLTTAALARLIEGLADALGQLDGRERLLDERGLALAERDRPQGVGGVARGKRTRSPGRCASSCAASWGPFMSGMTTSVSSRSMGRRQVAAIARAFGPLEASSTW